MPRKTLKFFGHAGFLSLKIFSVLAVFSALFLTIILWQMSQKPLDLNFAKEAIQAALYDDETGNSVQFERVILFWPKLDGPLLLGLQGAKMINKEGQIILSFDEAALSFSRSALLVGRILPKTIILKKPALRITRAKDNTISVGFGRVKTDQSKDDVSFITRILGYLARPGHEAAHRSIISRLEAFEIEDAQLLVEDHNLGMTWFLPHFTAGFFSVDSGLQANFKTSLPDVDGKPSRIQLGVNYIWDTKRSRISADIENLDTMILAGKLPELEVFRDQNIILNAHLDAGLDKNFLIEALTFNLGSENGTIFHPSLSEAPLPYANLKVSALYDTASKKMIFDNTSITLKGVTMKASGDIQQEKDKISGPIKLEINDVAQDMIGPLWPKIMRGDNSEKWIVHRMSKGRFQAVSLNLDLEALYKQDTGWGVQANSITAGFSFKDMDLEYRPPLHPVHGASGSGVFDKNSDEMKIVVDQAKLGGLTVKKANLLFDRLVEQGVGDVDMEVALNGPLQDVMKYLAEEPIHLNKESRMDLDKVKGIADLAVKLRFPAREHISLDDFKIGAEGELKGAFLPKVVKDLNLSDGDMDVSVKDGLFTMMGNARIDERDVKLEYAEYIKSEGKPFKSNVKADLIADPNIRTKLGIDLNTFIEGSLPVQVEYTTQSDKTAKALVMADMTPARFFVEPFGFEKMPSIKGQANFTAHFKDKELQKISDLNANGEGFDLKDSEISFIQKDKETLLSAGKIKKFTLGDTKGNLDFEIDKNRTAKIVLTSSFLDARPFLAPKPAKENYQQLPLIISVSASTMRTADTETVKAAQIFFDIDSHGKFNQMEMDAIAGASAVYLRYSPDESGKRTFRLKTDDAGAALRSFQVYSNIRGGKMVIYAEPVGGVFDRNLVGKAEIKDFKAVKAPILTKLLSLISVPGLLEAVSSDGLNFSKLEADFNWVFRKEGSVLVLKDGRTSGNSIGLTFDGTVDNANRQIDVKGTIVPMSEVNNILEKIPLVGDILTGGSGGIFAATYSIKGPMENPDIGVNPLSVLTPGILRRILFE